MYWDHVPYTQGSPAGTRLGLCSSLCTSSPEESLEGFLIQEVMVLLYTADVNGELMVCKRKGTFKPSCTHYILGNNNIFAFSTIPQCWNTTGSWNLSSWKTRNCLFHIIVNTITAYAMKDGATLSKAMFAQARTQYQAKWLVINPWDKTYPFIIKQSSI